MAITNVDAATMLLSYSVTDVDANYKSVVCESDSNIDGTMNVITDETKCGVLKGTGPIDWKASGTALVNTTPEADEGSYNEIQTLFLAKTLLYFKYTNVDESIYHKGRGWFTALGNQNASSGSSKFTWSVEINGDIENTPES